MEKHLGLAEPLPATDAGSQQPAPAPADLAGFLGALSLGQFVPGLLELGAECPADLANLEDEDFVELGLKKLQKRKLKLAVARAASAAAAAAAAPAEAATAPAAAAPTLDHPKPAD